MLTPSNRRLDVLSLLALSVLVVAFFWKIALTNLILVGVDVFTYFYPYRAAIDDALVHGRLPLWNPDLFMGVPLLANGQAGFFYPLNWPFAAWTAPQAINASIVLHVFLATVFFFAFVRDRLALPVLPAGVGAAIFGLGGYAGSLVEHVNQLQAAAWFPLLLLCLDRALVTRAWRWAALGGLVFGLQLLAGHAQVSFISVAGCGLWILGRWLKAIPHPRRLREWMRRDTLRLPVHGLIVVAAMGAIGAGLAAVQLLPMLELSGLSIRGGGMSYREVVAFSLPPGVLLQSLLPTYGLGPPVFSEYIAFVGMAGLLLAGLGFAGAWRRQIGLSLLLLAGFALALGGYDPLYYVLYKLVPGFGLFRAPARWLFLFAFGAAGFAALGLDGLRERAVIRRKSLTRWLIIGSALAVAAAMLAAARLIAIPPSPAPWLWAGTMLAAVVLTTAPRMPAAMCQGLLSMLVVAELFVATRWLPYNQPTAPEAFSALRPAIAYLLSEDRAQPWRILSYSDLTWDPGDLQDIRALYGDALSVQSIYEYTVAVKAKEIVAPNLALRYSLQSVDGYDGGILPLARFVGLQSLFLAPEQVNPDGRLRERLRAIPDGRWLDLFNVKYVIADKVFDVWVDGIYYDLGLGVTLAPGNSVAVLASGDVNATGLGIVSFLENSANIADGTPVGEAEVQFADGTLRTYILRAGRDTSESVYDARRPAHAKARVVHTLRERSDANEYYTRLSFDAAAPPQRITMRSLLPEGSLSIHGMSLIDGSTTTGKALMVARGGTYRLVHSGDVKVYEKTDSAPRAMVMHRATVQPDDMAALGQMREAGFDPGAQIILANGTPLDDRAAPTAAQVVTYQPERVVVHTDDPVGGYLLVKDAWYPGWQANVDNQPVPVERADTFFRAVQVPPGAHEVEMTFASPMLSLGAAASSITIVIGAVGLAAAWWRGRLRRN